MRITKKTILGAICLAAIATLAFALFSCDSRESVTRSRPQASFSVDLTVIKNYATRQDFARIQFKRNGQPFDSATITISQRVIPSIGGGFYLAQGSQLALHTGSNEVVFSSPADNYSKTTSIDLPDSFGITGITPKFNSGVDVQMAWSRPARANNVILSIMAADYPANNTTPLTLIFPSEINAYTVLDTTFEDSTGVTVPDVYYIFMAAYNQGFGSFDGLEFPLPPGLTERRILDPSGFLRYGTIAPSDSIVILP